MKQNKRGKKNKIYIEEEEEIIIYKLVITYYYDYISNYY